MKRVIHILFLCLGILATHAQSEIYISDAARDINIVTIASGNCGLVNVVNTDRTLSDITLHPNGNMYGCNFSNRTIYEVNLGTGVTTAILTITEANRLVGMTAGADGLLYVTEGEVIPSDFYVVDPVAGTYVNKGPLTHGSAGDLTWSFGKLYNASDNNKLVEVNIEDPASSITIGDFTGIEQGGDRIFALVSVFTSCVETETFGLSEFGDYYSLDLNTAVVNRLCVGSTNIYGATSADEFLASECFIGIDLDGDNSSGLEGNDFQTNFDCPSTSAPVADDDAVVLVASQVDSLIISISSGLADGASEFLEVGSSPNLTISNTGFFLTAISTGASVNDIETFLSTLRYRNTAFPATPGLREITVIGFSEDKSDTAYAFIMLEGVNAGIDGAVNVCETDASFNLGSELGGSPDPGGNWSPTLMGGGTIFDPASDVAGIYTYTVSNGCFSDEADVVVTLIDNFLPDLGPDTSNCQGGNLVLNADVSIPGASYNWNTGETTSIIEVTTSGNYSVTVTALGCSFQDNINVSLGSINSGLPDQAAICPGESFLIDADIGSATAMYDWSTGETTPQITVFVSGEYWVTITDGDCEVTDTIMVTGVGNADVDLGEDTVLCEGGPLTLDADLMVPSTDYTWSTGETTTSIEVNSSGTYWVIADFGGCSFSDTIDVSISDLELDLGEDFTICTGDNVTLNADVGSPTASYSWSTGAMIPVINVTSGGTYWVVVTDDQCTISDTIIATEVSGGEIDFSLGPDQTICLGESVTFTSGFSPAIYDHTWSTGSNNPSITTSSEGSYILELSNQCQSGSDTVVLFVEDCDTIVNPPDTTIIDPPDTTIIPPDTIEFPMLERCEPLFPTAFSPNGDNHNDVFGLVFICPEMSEYEFRVYNRYGEELFKGNENMTWDGSFNGTQVPIDVFLWYLQARESSGDLKSWRGTVVVVR